MRSVGSLNIEYRISRFAAVAYACKHVVIVAQYCGRAVQELVHNLRTNSAGFTQHPQVLVNTFLNFSLYTRYTLFTHRVLHTFFMQLQSVSYRLCAQSTGPTITTTLINK
jgi:hypothetical protein